MTTIGTDQNSVNPTPGSTAAVLFNEREEILTKWLRKIIYRLDAAKKERRPVLVNTLPTFLMNLVQALTEGDSRQLAPESSSISQEHGGERARLTNFSPEDILVEYQILRDVILDHLRERTKVTPEEASIIYRSFDQAMTESMSNYFLVLTNLRERFSLFVSHEIRKPLGRIMGKALLMKKNPGDKDIISGAVDEIQQEVRRINTMIQEILDPSLIKNNEKLRLELKKDDLNTIVDATIKDLNRRFGDRFVYEGQKIEGYWNHESIRKAVESLCINAINYGDLTRVKVKVEEVHGRALISVHNSGKAIPVDKQEFIFQSFRRKENNGNLRGWGIGLPLVRGVAEAHGGSVGVDSSPEKGTTFMMDILIDSRPYQPSNLTPGVDDPRDFIL